MSDAEAKALIERAKTVSSLLGRPSPNTGGQVVFDRGELSEAREVLEEMLRVLAETVALDSVSSSFRTFTV